MPSAADQFQLMVETLHNSGLSYREIGERTQVSQTTIWRAANCMVKEPLHSTFVRVERLAEKVGTLPKDGRG